MKGLKQGCSMSPTLFKIYVQEALNQWCKKCSRMGIEMGESNFYTMLFADDQIILANYEDEITYLMEKLLEKFKKWELQVNISKTEYLCVGNTRHRVSSPKTIKKVKQNNYLGSLIT